MPGSLAEYTLTHSKTEGGNMEVMSKAQSWQPSPLEEQREERDEREEREGREEGLKDVRTSIEWSIVDSQRGAGGMSFNTKSSSVPRECLSIIIAETNRKLPKGCVFPPINSPQSERREKDDPAVLTLSKQQRKLEDNRCLLAELARIEQELRESLQREEEKQSVLDQIRQEENRLRWKSLTFLSLNQRTAKPFVNSYFKNIPMHIYCLPITSQAHKNSKKKKKKWKK